MSEKIDDGGPAFVCAESEHHYKQDGMSLRDWFAGMAMQGLLSTGPHKVNAAGIRDFDKRIAEESYASADAMLAARKK